MKYFLASSFKSGSIPYWCPNYFCGSPFISDIQSGVFYPLAIVFLIFPFPFSFNLFIVFHFFIGFCFFYIFIRELGLSRYSSIFSSISFCYGSYVVSSVNNLNNLSTAIWLPAILWTFKKGLESDNRSWLFLTVLFLCISILGGEPQLFIMTIGIFFLYGTFSTLPKISGKAAFKSAFIIFILIISAIVITLIQLGPTYIDYQYSVRMGGISYEEAVRHSLNPLTLKHLFFPLYFPPDFTTDPAFLNKKLPWLLTIYPGFLIIPFAILGILGRYKKTIFWAIIFIITLTLSLGKNNPGYSLFFTVFPYFRFPEKFIYISNFSLLIMAAYGFESLRSFLIKNFKVANLISCLIILVVIVDLFSNNGHINPTCNTKFYQKHHPDLQPILADQSAFRVYIDPDIHLSNFSKTIFDHNVKWQIFMMPNLGIISNVHQINGATGLELIYQHVITQISKKPWKDKIHFLRLANVKYIVTDQNLYQNPELMGSIQKINTHVYMINDYLPRAWIIGELKPVKKGNTEEITAGSFDPSTSAITKGNIILKYNTPFFDSINSINYKANNHIHIELESDTEGILMLSESSYPGWKVFIDGQEKECLWLNLLFQGVEIEKGYHEIDFIYRPKYFKLFSFISIMSLLVFLFIWSCIVIFDKRKGTI